MKEKITNEDLLLEIKAMLKEFFVCDLNDNKNELKLSFENGQSFSLKINEMH